MAKRYTEKEDLFIVSFYDIIGSYIGPHDLNRSKSSVSARAKKLKKSGAWEYYKISRTYRIRALILAGIADPECVSLEQPDLIRDMVLVGELK